MVEAIDAERVVLAGSPGSPWSTRLQFRHWLSENRSSFVELPRKSITVLASRASAMEGDVRDDAGWAAIGWPEHLGGLGGDARHRAVINDELGSRASRPGYAPSTSKSWPPRWLPIW